MKITQDEFKKAIDIAYQRGTKKQKGRKHKLLLILLLITNLIAIYLGTKYADKNTRLTYGNTGMPKNCRAIIAANIDGWRMGSYTAEEALGSIDRNCGVFGYSWGK